MVTTPFGGVHDRVVNNRGGCRLFLVNKPSFVKFRGWILTYFFVVFTSDNRAISFVFPREERLCHFSRVPTFLR